MRAAAADFRAARLLGVRADTVISFAFVIAGVLAAAVAILLTVQRPLVTPTFGLEVVILALVGVVVGGIDRLGTATLGGFAIGFVTSALGDVLPAEERVFLPSFVFLLVIVVLLVRPGGLFERRARTAVERV
jgi:branched-chain amino acid transport system permease protein